MARGVPLTPAQVETVKRVWLETANAAEASRQAECSPQSAARYIVREGLDSSGTLYAQALAKAERQHLDVVEKARRKISEALDSAPEVKDLAALAAQAHDGLRATTATKMAFAKLRGEIVDRTDVTSGGKPLDKCSREEIDARIAAHEARRRGGG